MKTPNKTEKLILEVIANNSGEGLTESQIQEKLASQGRDIPSYGLIMYLADMVGDHQLKTRTVKINQDDSPLLRTYYYLSKRSVA